jgi:hypothetical protein
MFERTAKQRKKQTASEGGEMRWGEFGEVGMGEVLLVVGLEEVRLALWKWVRDFGGYGDYMTDVKGML